MRKLMICASVMLALLQLWPMVFGHHEGSAAAAATNETHLISAVATTSPKPVKVAASAPPKGCYAHYRAVFSTCVKGDRTCQLHAADTWDLCEATGAWPE